MFSIPKRSQAEQLEDIPEQPKVHITSRGARYVEVEELFQSKRGKARIKAMADLLKKVHHHKNSEGA